jgi:uncharacterized delta-60 repeat protein
MGLPIEGDKPGGGRFSLAGFDGDTPRYHQTHNFGAAISTAVDQVRSTAPFNVDGTGWTAGLWEVGGIPRVTHQEFGLPTRVTVRDGYPSHSLHATHVAGTMAATGLNVYLKGMAPGLLIDAYSSTNDLSEMTASGAAYGGEPGKIYVSNHSYGLITGWSGSSWYGAFTNDGNPSDDVETQFGQYDSSSSALDGMLASLPYFLSFHSAGNDRDEGPPSNGSTWYSLATSQSYTYNPAAHPAGDGAYKLGYDTIDPEKACKNVMTVGAVNDAVVSNARNVAAGTIADFSSTGPADDGRIKPDVVGNGVGLYSPSNASDISNASISGTSMSCPNVSGSAMLLVDYYGDRFPGQFMRASTLKALIIHTADDVGNPGPDYFYGWGLMNTKAAADHIKRQADNAGFNGMIEAALSTSEPSDTFTFTWNGSDPIRVTLCWTDPAGTAVNSHDDRTRDLVNDLNLKLTGPAGSTHLPFVMPYVGDWTNAKLSANATTGVNTVDNVEQVKITAPPVNGLYTITVNHAGALTGGTQNYSLIISGQSTDALAVSPPDTFTATGNTGGPFTPSTKDYNLTNIGTSPLNWTAAASQAWVSLSPASGLLAAGQSTTVTATITPAANALSGGRYNSSLVFTNTTSGALAVRSAVLNTGRNFLNFNLDTNPGWSTQGQWAFGAPSGLGGDPSSAKTGTNVYGYNLSGSYTNAMPAYTLTTTALNCTGKQNVSIGFWRWLGIESSIYDSASVQVSRDGVSWTTVWNHTSSTFTDPAWTYVEYNIASVADNQPAVRVRWVIGPTDSSSTYAGWNIDDIVLLGDTIPPQPEIAVHDGASTAAPQILDEQTAEIDFGFTPSGTPVTRSFTIANTGTQPLIISSIAVPADFTVLSPPANVAAGASATFQIRYEGLIQGISQGSVVITSNDSDENLFDFVVKGGVDQPEIALSVAGQPVNDGQTQVVSYLSTSTGLPVSRSFTISNTGVTPLTISSITAPAGFTVLAAPTSVPGGGSGTFQLQLDATAPGVFSGSVVITNNDFNEGSFDFLVGGSVLATAVPAGMLDTTFAGTGSVITGNGGAGGILNGVVVQADGKNVVVGYTHNGISNDFVIMRYNTNGSLDSSFGTGGIAIVAVTSAADNAARVALQSDGKIVVCGTANSDFAVVRLNTNGTLDTSFDTDGIVTTPVLTGADIGTDLAIQTDGKIVVAGYASNGVNNDFAVVRYNANGSLDTSFDTDGKVTTAVGTGRDEANAVALTSTGLIIAAGRAAITGSGDDFALVRYTTAGALDTTFDTDGKFTHIMGTGAANDIIYDVAVDAADKIYAAGSTGANSGQGVSRYTAAGALDTSFLGGGRAYGYYLGSAQTFATALQVQSDGRIVTTGYGWNGTFYDAFISRFNSNGFIDIGFGGSSTGYATIAVGPLSDYGNGLALQSDGTVTVVGSAFSNLRDTPFVAMYNSSGFPVTSFDGDGLVTTIPGVALDFGTSLALKSDGSALLGGYSSATRSEDFAAMQWLADGTLNSTFGPGGKAVISASSSTERSYAAAFQSDGKVLLGGYITNTNNDDFQLLRLNADGTADNSFDTDGRVSTTIGTLGEIARAILVQPDGNIILAGYSRGATNDDFALVRYLPAGSLDLTFDTDGKVTTAVGSGTDQAFAAALQPDGKILVAGSAAMTNTDFAVVRYNANGSLDTSFDTDGRATFTMGTGTDIAYAVRLQSSGKIIVAGDASNDFGILRLNANGSLDTTFGTSGRIITAVGAGVDSCLAMAVQTDDKIIAVGRTHNGTDFDIAIYRFTAEGQLDTSFGTVGRIITSPGTGDDYANAVEVMMDGRIVVGGYAYQGTNAEFLILRYSGGSLQPEIALFNGDSILSPALNDGQLTAVDFGSVAVGSPITRDFTISNTGSADLILTSITPPAGFSVFNAPALVPAAGTAVFQLRLTAASAGLFSGNVILSSNDADEASFDFPVKGGVDQPEIALTAQGVPMLDAQTQPAAFRTTSQGSPVMQSFAIQNVGFATLSITSITPPAGFTVQNVPASIPTGSSATFQLTLTAASVGSFAGNAVIISNDTDEASFELPIAGNVLAGSVSPGQADPSFSGDGLATAGFTSAFAYNMIMQPDQKLLVAGFVNTPTDTAIARFLPNGSIDTSYGTSGRTTTAVSTSSDTAYTLALQPDGRLIIAGEASVSSSTDFMLLRQNADGTPDNTFDTDGRLTLAHGTLTDGARAVVVQNDGRIVVAGMSGNGTTDDIALARFNTNGSLDTTYGTAGRVTSNISAGLDRAYAAVLYPGGRVLIAGETRNAANTSTDFAIVRYNTDGSLDTSFGTGGIVKITPGTGTDIANALLVLPNGRILVAGEAAGDAAIARLMPDGALDTTFGTSGWTVLPVLAAADIIRAIALQPDGRILATGSASNGTNLDLAVMRFLESGQPDATFGTGGKRTFAPGTANDIGRGIAVQNDGSIVIGGGGVIGGLNDFFVMRLLPDALVPEIVLHNGASTTAPQLIDGQTAAVDFGIAALGTPVLRSFTLRNTGTSDLAISTITPPSGYTLLAAPATPLTPDSTHTFQARLDAASTGTFSGTLTINNNDGNESTFDFPLTSLVTGSLPYQTWATAAGLGTSNAAETTNPAGDGLSNLLKYAFNLNPAVVDLRTLLPGTGTSGLPAAERSGSGPGTVFRIEFIRRTSGGITYLPEKSTTLSSWAPITTTPVITPIAPGWERVIIEEPADPATVDKIFSRVRVTQP